MRLALNRLYQVLTSLLAFVTMTSAGPLDVEEYGGERGENLLNNPYLPSFLPTPANVTFLSGEEAVLKCVIENRGTRTVVWKRASDPNPLTIGVETFVGDERFFVMHRKHSLEWNLHIRHARPEDSGVYECQVIIKSKELKQMVLLHVDAEQYMPTLKPEIQISGSQFVEKGNILTLACNATGFDYPPDELDWFKDGIKLANGGRLHISKDVSLSEKTIVSKLQVSRADMDDAGTYVCRASDMQVTSSKVNVLNSKSGRRPRPVPDTTNEKRDSNNQSTTFGMYGPSSGCPLGINILPLVTSLLIHLITS